MSRGLPGRVDHLVLGSPDLDLAVEHCETLLGVRARPGGRHPRWGTHNALLSLGPSTYLELIAPDPDRSEPGSPVLFDVDRLSGPRLVRWCAAVDDLDAARELAADAGAVLGPVVHGSRGRPDGTTLSWRMTDPEILPGEGVIPFLIDWGSTPHPAGSVPRAGRLIELAATHPLPGVPKAALRALGLDLPVRRGDVAALEATIRTERGDVTIR